MIARKLIQGAVDSWLSPYSSVVLKGGTAQATFTVQYKSETKYNHTSTATWSSTNIAVATVTAGTITGKGLGSATLDVFDSEVPDYSYYCYSSDPDSTCPTDTGQQASGPEQTKATPSVDITIGGDVQYGQVPTISATVSSASGPTPTGSIDFSMTPAAVPPSGDVPLSGGWANWGFGMQTFPLINVGAYNVNAEYFGDTNYIDVVGGPEAFSATKADSIATITLCPSSVTAGKVAQFNVSVVWANNPLAQSTARPSGTVNLVASPYSGNATQATGSLSISGTVTFSVALAAGTYAVTARYEGDGNYNTDVSAQCSVTAH